MSAATATARPFRLRPPVVAETTLHASVADALDRLLLPPVQWTTFPAGAVPLPPEYAAKLARLGLKRGWPDILIVHGGAIYGIELKRVGGILSKSRTVRTRSGALRELAGQVDVFPKLTRSGMRIAICHTVEQVIDAVRVWDIPMRRVS